MIKRYKRAGISALSRSLAAVHLHWRAFLAARQGHQPHPFDDDHAPAADLHPRELLRLERPMLRRLIYAGVGGGGVILVAAGLLWWRLASGPLSLDLVTPWLTSAVEERLGGGHRIEVGGTPAERDDGGRTALRLRDIVVRDRDGTVVASAPKAEVGLSGSSLLVGQVQATRLSLIGATMAVRIDA